VGEALQEWIINEGNEQVKNKKTTTNNKTMQTQQRGKIRKQQQTIRQCKPNNVGNEHDTSGLLHKNV
jgi:hypothetical protein